MFTLLGIVVVILGFVLRVNPLLVIAASALVTGIAGGLDPIAILKAFGKAFNDSRYVSIIWIVLPVIGLLERAGLQERAKILISNVRAATAGRLLLTYMLMRQVTAAIGLLALGGHAQMVRPLVAPMAEAAAERRNKTLPDRARWLVRAYAASADNVGVFFGEDVFLAVGSILLIKGFLQQAGIEVQPLSLSMWAIPTAIAAFLIHGARLLRLDAKVSRIAAKAETKAP